MKIQYPFDTQTLEDSYSTYSHEIEDAEYHGTVELRHIEFLLDVFNRLMSLGCPEEKILDVLATIGATFLKGSKFNISDSIISATIKKNVDVRLRFISGEEINRINCLECWGYEILDSYKSVEEYLKTEPDSEFDNYYRFYLISWGIYSVGHHFDIVDKNDYKYLLYISSWIPLVRIKRKASFFKALVFIHSLYRNNAVFYEVYLKCLNSILPSLTINDLSISPVEFSDDSDPDDSPFRFSDLLITKKKLYKILKTKYNKKDRSIIFKMLEGIDYEVLEEYFDSGDQQNFCNYIKEASNFRGVNIMCSLFDRYKRAFEISIYCLVNKVEQSYLLLKIIDHPEFKNVYTNLSDVIHESQSFEDKLHSALCNKQMQFFDEVFDRTKKMLQFIENILKPSKCEQIYKIIDNSNLPEKIKKQLKHIENDTETVIDISEELGDNAIDSDYSECGDFKLPDNFIELDVSNNYDEFFAKSKFEIDKENIQDFEELINYISRKHLVEKTNVIKQTLVYRLTGKWRPDNDELAVIEWNDDSGNGNNLIYLIKEGIDQKGKYEKMKKFFTGPNFPNDAAKYGDRANDMFVSKLSKLMPKIFNKK